jgi:hypothetical protein
MKVSRIPIQAQAARFLVGGARGKRGYALLYPANLTTVVSPIDPAGTWADRWCSWASASRSFISSDGSG